jgi:vitamin B12 transporter
MPSFRSLVLLVIPGAAAAQQSRDTTTLAPVVISATRTAVPVVSTTSTVTVLDGETLRARGITHVSEALRSVPGLAVVQSGSFGGVTSLFVRGANSNSVKVLVDGMAINSPGGAIDLAHLTTDGVERIEVLRGPASVVYGSDAVAGVIQIFTRHGSGAPLGGVSARGGSFGSREAAADIAGGTGPLSYAFAAADRRTDGTLDFNNDYRNGVVSGAVGLGAADAPTRARLSARYTDATFHYPTDGAGNVVDSNAVRDDDRLVLALDASRRLTSRASLKLFAGMSGQHAVSINQPDSPGDTLGFYTDDHGRTQRRSADLRASVALGGASSLAVGAAIEREQVRATGTSVFGTGAPSTTSFDEHRTSEGYYVQLVRAAEHGFSGAVSGRVDHSATFGTFTTGRVTGGYRFLDGTRLRAAVGNAFKAPAFEEIFTSPFTVGNLDLAPERSVSYEVGVERGWSGERVHVALTGFAQRFRDLIQYVDGDASTSFAGHDENLAAAKSSGLELELTLAPSRWVDARATYTALKTEVTDAGNGAFGTFVNGERLLRRPGQSAAVDVGVHPVAHAELRAAVLAVGPRDDYDFDFANPHRVELPGYARVDLSGSYAVVVRGAERLVFTARVENVFDTEYQQALGFISPGVTLLAGARVAIGR